MSPYIYVNNNPIALKDVNGEYWISARNGQPAVFRYPVPVAYAAYGAEWVPLAGGILNLFRRYGFADYNVSGSDIGLGFLGGKSLRFVGQTFRRFANGARVADAALLKAGLSSAITPFDRGVDAIIGADLVSQSKRDVLIFALAEVLGYGTNVLPGVSEAFGVFLLNKDLLNDPRRKFDPKKEFEKLDNFFKLSKEKFIKLHGEETYNTFIEAQRRAQRRKNRDQEFDELFEEFSRGRK